MKGEEYTFTIDWIGTDVQNPASDWTALINDSTATGLRQGLYDTGEFMVEDPDDLLQTSGSSTNSTLGKTGKIIVLGEILPTFDVDINGDYNRDENPVDHANESAAVTFAGPKGMVILANNDDDDADGEPDGDKSGDPLKYRINGASDLSDIYILELTKLGISTSSIPADMSVIIEVLDPETEEYTDDAIIYKKRQLGEFGNSAFNFSSTSTPTLAEKLGGTGTAEIGIEGRKYGKDVIVRMTLQTGSGVIGTDEIRVLISPFIVLSNTDKAVKVYTGSDSDAASWPLFHADLTNALSGVVPVVSLGSANWMQDYGEIGYTQSAPEQPVDKRTVIAGLAATWFKPELDDSTAYFFLGGGVGGGIEASPPITGFPYGRVILGCKTNNGVLDYMVDFFEQQNVQTDNGSLIVLPVDWLQTGHVDEVFTIIPVGTGFKVLVADLDLAIDLLNNNPTNETAVGFESRTQILAHYNSNSARVAVINAKLATVRTALSTGLNIPESQFVKVPVAYSVATPSKYYLPNMINMLVVKNSAGSRKLVVPEPYFEPFAVNLDSKLTASGYGAVEIYWINTTEPHSIAGEAHCVTNPRRVAE